MDGGFAIDHNRYSTYPTLKPSKGINCEVVWFGHYRKLLPTRTGKTLSPEHKSCQGPLWRLREQLKAIGLL